MARRRLPKWVAVIGLFCLVLLALSPSVQAFETREGDNVAIPAGEVIEDDLFAAASSFVLDGVVKGDLIVVGGTIKINGTVEGDLMAAGQQVIVTGVVEDDARIAGQVLALGESARIADDLMAAGFSLETQAGSSIGGSLLWGGYQVLLAGDVAEDLLAGTNRLELRGRVGGDVNAEVGEPGESFPPFMQFIPGSPPMPSIPGGLTVGQGAEIGGNLDYTSAVGAGIPAGSVAGEVTREEPVVEVEEEEAVVVVSPAMRAANWFLEHLRRLVGLLVVGLLMVWVVPAAIKRSAGLLEAKPLPSLGWGVVTIFAVFVALMITLVATILLAVILGLVTLGNLVGTVVVLGMVTIFDLAVLFGLAVAYVTKIVVSFLIGRLILARLNPDWAEGRVWPLVLGVVIFVIITAIPWLGGLISLVVVLLGLGSLWLLGREALRQRRATSAEAVA